MQPPIIGLGIDPDLHHLGVGVVSRSGLIEAGTINIPGRFKAEEAVVLMGAALADELALYFNRAAARGAPISHVAIEGQTVYDSRVHTRNPKNILQLATVAGAAMNACFQLRTHPLSFLRIPEPKTWKGQVPKAIHQLRTVEAIGSCGWNVSVPKDKTRGLIVHRSPVTGLNATQWKHALDAVGLAWWAVWETKTPKRRWCTTASR